MALITGTRSVGNGTQGDVSNNIAQVKRKIDMVKEVALLQPSEGPLLRLMYGGDEGGAMLRSAPCSDPMFNFLEDDLKPCWDAANGTVSTTISTITVDNPSYFTARDLIVVSATGEVCYVSAVSGNDLTVTRGGTPYTIKDNYKLLIIGNANEEGASVPTLKSTIETKNYNYTQIFRNPCGVTKTLKATTVYGESGNDQAYQRKKALIEHKRSIEQAFLFGTRAEVTSGVTSGAKRYTGGLLSFITTNVTSDTNGILTEAEWNAWLEGVFTYGSDKKVVLCGSTILRVLNNIAVSKLQINDQATKKYGMKIEQWKNAFGEVNLIHHRLMVNEYAGYAIALDMANLRRRYLSGNGENRDTHLMTNVVNDGTDAEIDEYLTETGLEVKLEKTMGVLKGVTSGPT